MFKDLSMRVFLAHLAAFVVITAGLAAINLWFAPQYPWFVWVLMGWGAAMATHALALLLRKTHRRERIFIDPKARTFVVHLFIYLAVVLLLFVVNYTQTPKVWWFYWVALGWGAGVAAQAWCVFYKHRRRPPQRAGATPPPAKSPSPRAAPKRTSKKRK